MSGLEGRRSRDSFLPDPPNEAVSQKRKWSARSRCGFALRWGKKDKDCSECQILLYPLKQAGQGFDFSAPAVEKLVAVPMYSPQCLNRATGHHLHSDYEQKHSLPWVHAHTVDLIRSQL